MTQRTKVRQDDICSREAEAGAIGSMVIMAKTDPSRIAEVMAKLSAEDFYLPEHRAMYDAICDIYIKTSILDPILLREELKQRRQLADVGGVDEYLVKVIETVPSAANLDYFVKIVKEKAQNRHVVRMSESIVNVAVGSERPDEKIRQIQELALGLTPTEARSDVCLAEDIAQEGMEDLLKDSSGIRTGFERLDWHLGGLHAGDMVVVAARPSQGKTAFATDVALNIARGGRWVAFYSLEMTRVQLVQRMICNIARVDAHRVQRGEYAPSEVDELATAAGTLGQYRLVIIDYSQLTPETFRASLKTTKQRFGLDCVILDYLQLMQVKGKTESRQQEITTISRNLKAAAKAEEVPMIVLSQLNREVEHRANHKPQLADLRESGSIEQDADVVILLHRPDWYRRGESPATYTPTGNGIFQVAKSRNGPTGEVELQFNEKYVSFANIAKAIA